MVNETIYNWYLKNGVFDDELISFMQLQCFNKPITAVRRMSYQELDEMLNTHPCFNDPRIVFRFWWIFDDEYAVIDGSMVKEILQELRDITNPWTVVAIVQAVTGLNSGFIWLGIREEETQKPAEERKVISGYGFITDTGLLLFTSEHEEVKSGVLISFAVFD